MKLKIIVVDFEIPRRVKRAMVLAGVPAGVLLGVSALALATVPHTFNNGDVLNASDLNTDFSALDTRLTTVEGKRPIVTAGGDAGAAYSLDGKYCGKTSNTTGSITSGSLTGWAAAKSLCQAACGTSPTAHMCSGEEMNRSAQLGVSTDIGWRATGDFVWNATIYMADCEGWTSAATTVSGLQNYGSSWVTSPDQPSNAPCTTSLPILCCD